MQHDMRIVVSKNKSFKSAPRSKSHKLLSYCLDQRFQLFIMKIYFSISLYLGYLFKNCKGNMDIYAFFAVPPALKAYSGQGKL